MISLFMFPFHIFVLNRVGCFPSLLYMGGRVENGAVILTGAETWMLGLLRSVPWSVFMAALFPRTVLRG